MKLRIAFFIALISSVPLRAQTLTQEDRGTVRTSSSSLYKAGKELVASISIDITRDLTPNESLVLVPIVSDSLGNRLELPSIYVNSRKQQIVFLRETAKKEKDAQALQRINGNAQTMRYLHAVPFEKWMNRATLSLIEKSCGCGIADKESFTCIARIRPQATFVPQLVFITPLIEESKIRNEKGCAYIDFALNSTVINQTFSDNTTELSKIRQTIDIIRKDTNVTITHISIHGYASPDGPYKLNERLAFERTQSLKKYVCQLYAFKDSLIRTSHTPEDWEGLEALLSDTVFPQKEQVTKVIESEIHPDQKESKLKRQFPVLYSFMLKNWFPLLRHSDYIIEYHVRPFTIEESKNVFATNPKNLSLEEMFRLALTYTTGSEPYNKIFMTAVQLYPDDPIANLNAACIALMQRDTSKAMPFLAKAPLTPETALAKGVFHFLQDNLEKAEKYFKEAKDSGLPQADDNLKQIIEFK